MTKLVHFLRRLYVAIAATLGTIVIVVTFTPLVHWWAVELAGPWTEARGDTLIVLTGNVLENGIIGEPSYWRGAYAVMAWREGGFRRIVVTGGGGGAAIAVGDAIKIFLMAGGVPGDAITTEIESRSTRDSARNMATLLRDAPGRKVLLTSDYHMFRAVRAFRKAGVEVIPRPIPDASKRGGVWNLRWDAFVDLITETAKIGYYRVRGWI